MKKTFTHFGCLFLILILFPVQTSAQLFQQDFSGTLAGGNTGGGTKVANADLAADAVYVDANASTSQFTFLATNNELASIELKGDGVMRLARGGSGTVYVIRNVAFAGPPSAVKFSFDFNAEITSSSSTSAIQFMLGDGFANTKSEPVASAKHSRFYINTKTPTGTPGTWGVTPENAASESAYSTAQTVTWVVNNSGSTLTYTAPGGVSETVADDKYDVWVGTTKHIDEAAAITGTVDLKNFEIRIAGGNGTYTIDNLSISAVTAAPAGSAITDHFRSKVSGNWNNTESWESSPDGVNWINATLTPNDSSATISVMEGDTITVTAAVTVDQMTINAGGVVIVNGTPVRLTVANGEGAVDLLVNGLLKATGSPIASPGPYSVSIAEGASVSFGNGGVYEHNQNAGAIPAAQWGTGSTLKITGVAGNAPANGNQNFCNVEWNSPSQSSNLNLGWNNNTITGNLNIVATGGSRWQMTAPPTDSTVNVTILGNIIQTGGNFSSNGTSNGFTTVNIHHYGNVNVTGGNFSVSRGSQNTTGTTNWYLYGQNISLQNATTQNSNPDGAKFIFAGTEPQNLTLTNVKFTGGFPIEINSGAHVNLGETQVRGSGKFILKAGAGVGTAHFGGLDSAFVMTGAKSLSQEGNYTFNGTVEQITGSLLPAAVNKLTINNTAGVKLSKDVTVNNSLSVSGGDLKLDGYTVTLGASGILTETPANTVNGLGKLTITTNVGTPSALNVGGLGAVLTANKDLGSTTVERYHSAPVHLGNSGILRSFRIAPGQNNSGLNASLKFYYDESELNGLTEAALILSKSLTGADNSWYSVGGTVNTTDNYIELSGITDFSYWAAGSSSTPLPVELISFTAVSEKDRVILSWNTATEIQNQGWNIERRIKGSADWSNIGFVQGAGDRTEPAAYSFIDKNPLIGSAEYRLRQLDYNGTSVPGKVIEVLLQQMPNEYLLHQNYPNPFNPETKISFELPQTSFVNISVFNALGELVSTLVNKNLDAGVHSVVFEAANMNSGIYIYQLRSADVVFTKKMILIR